MLSLEDLTRQIEEYSAGRTSFDDFEDWFRTNSRGAYRGGSSEVSGATVAVESAFSQYYFAGLDEPALKRELAKAVRAYLPAAVKS